MVFEFQIPRTFDADEHGNQHTSFVQKMSPCIKYVQEELQRSRSLSSIANELIGIGMPLLMFMSVVRQATGANLGGIKGLSQWWSDDGIVDSQAFDEWAKAHEIS
ncbi:MAG: hypothetical protein AAF711_08495 [Planctomycetota bacterium]